MGPRAEHPGKCGPFRAQPLSVGVLRWETHGPGASLGGVYTKVSKLRVRGGWVCGRRAPASCRVVTHRSHLLFFLHGQRVPGTRPQAGLPPLRSAPPPPPPVISTRSWEVFPASHPVQPHSLSGWRSPTPDVKEQDAGVTGLGPTSPEDSLRRVCGRGPGVTSRSPANGATRPQGSIAQQIRPRT